MSVVRTPDDREGAAEERAALYGLLAAVFRAPPTPDLLRQLRAPRCRRALSQAGVRLEPGFFAKPEAQVLEGLALEFTGLFVGPGPRASPYASISLDGPDATLWGKSTARIKAFIEEAGFQFRPRPGTLPDHISVALEFMQALIHQDVAAEAGDETRHIGCRRLQQAFLDQFLRQWIAEFHQRVVAAATTPFYGAMAGLAREFVQSEGSQLPEEKRLSDVCNGIEQRFDGLIR